ncbi:hypothetical protein OG871_08915 [Kitasatospora sp. NBC_00374]|uniref:hypothetical protein n=1 Tax=Kitasatospora sp. NBC_00374 TaxID=2975964 RepID=UPI0030DFB403
MVHLELDQVFTDPKLGLGATALLFGGEVAAGDRLWLSGPGVRRQVTVASFALMRACFGPPAGGGTGVILGLADVTEDEVRSGMLLLSEEPTG